jgi:CheY-like chemotaxis protein
MTARKILLVNNQAEEVELIQKTIDQFDIPHSLSIAKNAAEALYILMGSSMTASENYFRSRKIRPHAILLTQDLPDMSGLELLGIIRKYYSLKNIKIFLLTKPGDKIDSEICEQLAITACLNISPGAEEPVTGFDRLKAELDSDEASRTSLTVIPMAGVAQKKTVAVKSTLSHLSLAPIAKAAVFAAALMAVGGTINYRKNQAYLPVSTTTTRAAAPAINPEQVQELPSPQPVPAPQKTSARQAGSVVAQPRQQAEIIQSKDSLPLPVSSAKHPRPVTIKALPDEDFSDKF